MTDHVPRMDHLPRPVSPKPGACLALLALILVAWAGSTNPSLARQDKEPKQSDPVPSVPALPPGFQPPTNPVPVPLSALGSPPAVAHPLVIPPIDPKTPLEDLLPTPPTVEKVTPFTGDDLTKVPEVQFQAPLAKDPTALQQTAILLARINHINRTKSDGFLEALIAARQDLAGMPFAMGDACRTKGERSKQFAQAVAMVRLAQQGETVPVQTMVTRTVLVEAPPAPIPADNSQLVPNPPPIQRTETIPVTQMVRKGGEGAAQFWKQYRTLCDQQDAQVDKEQCEHVTVARIAALMQILAPEASSYRLGLVKYLSGVSHPEATRALARLALFSAEDEVRLAAVAALEVRRESDYTEVLVRGLRYPYPKVAQNAADAIVRLKRADLLPQLVAVLDEPDPRLPEERESGSKKVTMVRELVRVNHHRNCVMCHSPSTNSVPDTTLTAGVPLPSEPLSGPGGYQQSRSETLVRIDVTYLRQDFSMFQAVPDANPWPEMQRFDFLVRTRQVSAEEAAAYRATFGVSDPTRPSPYQKAALAALREMTGRDTAPTGEAWRKLLGLPRAPEVSFNSLPTSTASGRSELVASDLRVFPKTADEDSASDTKR